MKPKAKEEKPKQPPQPNIFALLKPYRGYVLALVFLAISSNALNLVTPKLVSHAIDAFVRGTLETVPTLTVFFGVIALVFVLTYIQSIVQTYASEKVARDLRNELAAKIAEQSFLFVQGQTPSKLLTNLTSDIDGIKLFVSQAIVALVSSAFLVLGASALLLSIHLRLGLAVLIAIPLIASTFFFSFAKVRKLFLEAQGVIDRLNKVINESILGSALIRVLNSQKYEYDKFVAVNTEAKNIGLRILSIFAGLIPLITFFANMALLTILVLGGHYVMTDSLSLGDFTAFMSYLAILIFPILVIGFMSTIMARATASYGRIVGVLNAPKIEGSGTIAANLKGKVEMKHASLVYGEKTVLKDVSLLVPPGTKTAIIGPTAAGKTQLLFALTGLIAPHSGEVLYDDKLITAYDASAFYRQIGLVFQDSIVFNMTIRENIAFSDVVTDESLEKAIETAELKDFLDALPDGLNTMVSERGTSLSGGQKQRIMLARALAQNPRVLYLDDFTARVDALTEKKILDNVARNYPDLTLISVTQKISSVESYDQIVLLMEGEILARGTHEELLESSPEYVQIFESQKSTSHYELPTS